MVKERKMVKEMRYLPAGDKVIVVEFGNEINQAINHKVMALYQAINSCDIEGIEELIPTYRSLMVQYNPSKVVYKELINRLKELSEDLDQEIKTKQRIIEVPVIYGQEFGPDIEFVASHNNISVDEVIQIHTSQDYLIYMLGFTPGFPYLGGMSDKIETPRLETPRNKIPVGSVGIAGKQTGIYPIESPGGWQLIGRTPITLYDPYREPPILMQAGDFIRFVSVGLKDYRQIETQVAENTYSLKISYK
ncbi:MAG TPA: 5-oxoprolinase subunit PxpB [Desulfosporosinus sp.]|nr:5-oxoprolinase subunit PxpB [Desulfosporosinus sp.]